MKVALFVTCLADGLIPEVAKATVRVLERLGVAVDMPIGQTCCGQIHLNTGYPREALPLVRNHVAAFEPYDAIVAPSGSCTAAIRHQHADLARRCMSRWAPRSRRTVQSPQLGYVPEGVLRSGTRY